MSDDISAVMGATTTIKTLADGTFRLSVDVEPRFAQQAFALFGSPGTPVALARITNDAAIKQGQPEPEPDKPKGGALAKLAGMLCGDPEFWAFLNDEFSLTATVENADDAADVIRNACQIKSRVELDSNPEAESDFHASIRGPWLKYRAARGLK